MYISYKNIEMKIVHIYVKYLFKLKVKIQITERLGRPTYRKSLAYWKDNYF